MTKWSDRPAIFMVLAKLVELHARARRVDDELRRRRDDKVLALAEKVD